jgi:hypothetical protein
MKKILITSTLAIAIGSMIVLSCKKKDDDTPDYSSTSEVNSTQSDFDDLHKIGQDAMGDNNVVQRTSTTTGCTTITWNGTDSITFDFGNGCVGSDGRTRQGKLFLTYTAHYKTSGAVIKIKTRGYTVDGKKIQGMRTITNGGLNGSGHLVYTIKDTDTTGLGYAKVTQVNGNVGTWKSTRTREWSAGASTPGYLFDDELIINGSADGVSSEGVVYSMTATDIDVKASCWLALLFQPVSGVLSVTLPDGTRSLDYGTGECDKTAVYTHTNGKTYTITLQ